MSERNYERINDLPEGITPVTGAELVELEQDGVSRKFSMTALAGITNPHEETHQRGGADAVGTLEKTAYAIPYLESDGTIDTRVSDATTSVKGKVQLATDGEESAAKPPASTDSRLKDKRDPTEHAIEHVAGGDVIPNATVTVPGLMSATDKVKADATIPEYIPTEDQKAALTGTSGTPGAGNKYVTDADERLPTVNQKAALAGSYGTPSGTNRYVTEDDPILEGIGGGVGAVGGTTLIGVGELGTELLVGSVGIGDAGMARLSEDLVAFFHKDIGELRTYQRSGSTWTQVGSGLPISGAGTSAMAGYSSTTIIFIDSGNKELRAYQWSGTAWSSQWTSLSIPGLGTPSIAVLTSTEIALIDSGNRELRTYELSGTEWSLAGTSFSIPGFGTPSIISLGPIDVALVDSGTGLLSKYRKNISNSWIKIGNSTSIPNGAALARLNATDISVVSNYSAGNCVIRAYRWASTSYERLEKDLYISGDFVTTVALGINEIALFDATTDKLRIYSFLFGYDSASVNIYVDYEVPEIFNGKSIIVRRTSAYDGNPVTITPPSGATFEGLASINLYGQYSYVELERISATVFAIKDLIDFTFRASSSFTLPSMPDGARKRILNTHATNAITVTAYAGTTIEGQATMTLSAGHEVEIELIGTDWRKVVLSQSVAPSAGKAMVWGVKKPEYVSTTEAHVLHRANRELYGTDNGSGICTVTDSGNASAILVLIFNLHHFVSIYSFVIASSELTLSAANNKGTLAISNSVGTLTYTIRPLESSF